MDPKRILTFITLWLILTPGLLDVPEGFLLRRNRGGRWGWRRRRRSVVGEEVALSSDVCKFVKSWLNG